MARVQTLIQLSDAHLAALDERAAQTSRSRSDLVREAVDHYLADGLEAEIDRQIVEGYRRVPPRRDEWHEIAAVEAIRQEPW